jgi:hypothetical protein
LFSIACDLKLAGGWKVLITRIKIDHGQSSWNDGCEIPPYLDEGPLPNGLCSEWMRNQSIQRIVVHFWDRTTTYKMNRVSESDPVSKIFRVHMLANVSKLCSALVTHYTLTIVLNS